MSFLVVVEEECRSICQRRKQSRPPSPSPSPICDVCTRWLIAQVSAARNLQLWGGELVWDRCLACSSCCPGVCGQRARAKQTVHPSKAIVFVQTTNFIFTQGPLSSTDFWSALYLPSANQGIKIATTIHYPRRVARGSQHIFNPTTIAFLAAICPQF